MVYHADQRKKQKIQDEQSGNKQFYEHENVNKTNRKSVFLGDFVNPITVPSNTLLP